MPPAPALRRSASRGRPATAALAGPILGVAILTACAAPPSAPGTADGPFPVTITHRYGETVVPEPPTRIAALGQHDQDVLLALDIVPIGMARTGPDLEPWAARRLAEVRRRTGDTTTPVETQLQPSGPDVLPTAPAPDLILAATDVLGQQDYDDDSVIAPVVGPPPGYGDPGSVPADYDGTRAPWQDSTRLVGRAVGKPAETDRLVAGVEARFATARARHPRLQGRTAACVHWGTGRSSDAYAYPAGPATPCSRFLAALGMRGVSALDRGAGEVAQAVTAPVVAAARPDLVVLDEPVPGRRDVITRYLLPPGQPVATLNDTELTAVGAENVLSLPVALDTVPEKLARTLR